MSNCVLASVTLFDVDISDEVYLYYICILYWFQWIIYINDWDFIKLFAVEQTTEIDPLRENQ